MVTLLSATFNDWYEDRAQRMGAALAYYTIFEQAIKKTGRADRKSIRDALEGVDVPDTPVGRIKFDETHQAFINMLRRDPRRPAQDPGEDRHPAVARIIHERGDRNRTGDVAGVGGMGPGDPFPAPRDDDTAEQSGNG